LPDNSLTPQNKALPLGDIDMTMMVNLKDGIEEAFGELPFAV
jgi:hypothetical protein